MRIIQLVKRGDAEKATDPNDLADFRDHLVCLTEHIGKTVLLELDFENPNGPEDCDYDSVEDAYSGLSFTGQLHVRAVTFPDGTSVPSWAVIPLGASVKTATNFIMFHMEQVALIQVKEASSAEPYNLSAEESRRRYDYAMKNVVKDDDPTPQLVIKIRPRIADPLAGFARVPKFEGLGEGLVDGGKI